MTCTDCLGWITPVSHRRRASGSEMSQVAVLVQLRLVNGGWSTPPRVRHTLYTLHL